MTPVGRSTDAKVARESEINTALNSLENARDILRKSIGMLFERLLPAQRQEPPTPRKEEDVPVQSSSVPLCARINTIEVALVAITRDIENNANLLEI